MANINCNTDNIIEWTYKDKQHMDNLLFIENKYERQKYGEQVLQCIKPANWLKRLFLRLTNP